MLGLPQNPELLSSLFIYLFMVTHLSSDGVWHATSTLIKTNALSLSQTATQRSRISICMSVKLKMYMCVLPICCKVQNVQQPPKWIHARPMPSISRACKNCLASYGVDLFQILKCEGNMNNLCWLWQYKHSVVFLCLGTSHEWMTVLMPRRSKLHPRWKIGRNHVVIFELLRWRQF